MRHLCVPVIGLVSLGMFSASVGSASAAPTAPAPTGPLGALLASANYADVGGDEYAWVTKRGVDPLTFYQFANPEPVWVLKWPYEPTMRPRPTKSDAETAVKIAVQAMSNRTWADTCPRIYARFAAMSAGARGSNAYKNALAATDYYDKVDGARAALTELAATYAAAGIDPFRGAAAARGPYFEMVRELALANLRHGTPDATSRQLQPFLNPKNYADSKVLDTFRTHGGPTIDEGVFCEVATSVGVGSALPPLPRFAEMHHDYMAARVKWPSFATAAQVSSDGLIDGWIRDEAKSPPPGPPGKQAMISGAITSVGTTKGGATFVLQTTSEHPSAEPSSCRKIGRKFENGRFVDDLACTYPTVTETSTTTVEYVTLPTRLQPMVGDRIEATIAETTPPTSTTKKGKQIQVTNVRKGALRHLLRLERGGKEVGVY